MSRRVRKQGGFTVQDAVLTLCLIGLLFGVALPRYQRVAKEAQETALLSELRNIRMSIRLFAVINKRHPESLREMTEKEVLLPARTGDDAYTGSLFRQRYLTANAVDEKGNILDSFGNPFRYDPRRGEVRATTKGYETW